MASFVTIIDQKGLPLAWKYYKFFPREPSPAGHMKLDPQKFVGTFGKPPKGAKQGTGPISLAGVLDEMAKVSIGGTVLIVCHGYEGPWIPMFKHGPSKAGADAFDMIQDFSRYDDEVAKIKKKKSEAEQKKAWWDFLNTIATVNTPPPDSPITVFENTYNKWLEKHCGKLGIDVAKMRILVTKMKAVQARGLKRVELRACNMDKTSINSCRRFFGAQECLAPLAQGTFYTGNIPVSATPNPNLNKPLGGSQTNKTRKTREIYKDQLVLTFWKIKDYTYKIQAVAVPAKDGSTAGKRGHTPDAELLKRFVREYIMPTGKYDSKNFRLAGLYAPYKAKAKVYVFPNEPEYTKAIHWSGKPKSKGKKP